MFSNSDDFMIAQFLTLLLPFTPKGGTLLHGRRSLQSLAFLSPNPKIRVTCAPVCMFLLSTANHQTSSQKSFDKF